MTTSQGRLLRRGGGGFSRKIDGTKDDALVTSLNMYLQTLA